jgi:hypothetical protein
MGKNRVEELEASTDAQWHRAAGQPSQEGSPVPPDDHADFVALDEGAEEKMRGFVQSRGLVL